MGCIQGKGIVHAYYEPNGELVQFSNPRTHRPNDELVFVSSQDTKQFQAMDECYILSAVWLSKWLEYVMKKNLQWPGLITNNTLLKFDNTLKPNLKPRVDYRPVNKAVWEYLFKLYGGGPVITFKVPAGLSSELYESGKWVKKITLSKIITVIVPNSFPKPNSYQMVSNPMAPSAGTQSYSSVQNTKLAEENAAALEAKQAEINQSNVEAIGALMNKDLGKKKMEEASAKNEEATQAAAEAIANQLAGGLSEKLKEQANEANEQAQTAQMDSVGQMFQSMNAKKRFREALAAGNMTEARIGAVGMLKNAWRAKIARRKMLALKAQKVRLMEESMARKLQSKYRARLANKRMIKLREERDRLRQQGAALMLQGSWRCRKAREKTLKLKQEKHRLLCEKQALRLQQAWRIKKAKMIFMGKVSDKKKWLQKRADATAKLVPFILRFLARLKYRAKLRAQPHVFIVTLKSAKDINIGDVATSDPYVLLHGERSAGSVSIAAGQKGLAPKSSANNVHATASRPTMTYNNCSNTLSLYKSKVIQFTLNPKWNEEGFVCNTTGLDNIVLTLMDKDVLNADDFLGQTVIPLKSYPQLFHHTNNVVTLPLLPIGSYSTPVHDAQGKEIPLSSSNTPGKGTFDITIRLVPSAHCQTGWMQKQAVSMLKIGAAQFKHRFVLLVNNTLSYHDDGHSLSAPRGTMKCNEMKAINYGPDKAGEMSLEFVGADDTWRFRWAEGESDVVIQTWLRKLSFACRHIQISGYQSEIRSQRSNSIVSSASTQQNGVKKTLSRRASNMFGSFHNK